MAASLNYKRCKNQTKVFFFWVLILYNVPITKLCLHRIWKWISSSTNVISNKCFDIYIINTLIWFPLLEYILSMNIKTSNKQLMFQKNVSFFFVLFDKEGYLHFIFIKLMNNMDMNYECIIIYYRCISFWQLLRNHMSFPGDKMVFSYSHSTKNTVKFLFMNIFPGLSQRCFSMKNAKSYLFVLRKI